MIDNIKIKVKSYKVIDKVIDGVMVSICPWDFNRKYKEFKIELIIDGKSVNHVSLYEKDELQSNFDMIFDNIKENIKEYIHDLSKM